MIESDDLISRRATIEALWKVLLEYVDKTEKQFIERDDLDVGDWVQHRGFVQSMSDLDRWVILTMPTVDAVPVVRCKDCRHFRFHDGTFGKGWMCFESNTARHGDDYCSRGERREDETKRC